MNILRGLAGVVWFAATVNGFATQRYVPGGGSPSYSTIQAAVNASVAGDIIRVQPGTYSESVAFRSVDITLTSTNPSDSNVTRRTIIAGNGTRSTVTFAGGQTSKTLFTGFTGFAGTGFPTSSIATNMRYALFVCCRSPVSRFSFVTRTPTSSDDLKTRFTDACKITTSPCFTG